MKNSALFDNCKSFLTNVLHAVMIGLGNPGVAPKAPPPPKPQPEEEKKRDKKETMVSSVNLPIAQFLPSDDVKVS